MGEIVSFASGVCLFAMCVLVMIAYWPAKISGDRGANLLGFAIFLAFTAAAANTLYWQIGGKVWLLMGNEWSTFREMGNYLDAIFKGCAAYAGWLHLASLRERLNDDERKEWSTIEMPWYPARRVCLQLLSATLWRKK